MSSSFPQTLLIPNFGAEEGLDYRVLLGDPFYLRLARLWSLLFGESATIDGVEGLPDVGALFDRERVGLVFPIGDQRAALSWLATDEIKHQAESLGYAWQGPEPALVRRWHDKGTVRRLLRDQSNGDDLARVFDPEELTETEPFWREVLWTMASWPEETRADWTLKPRWGSSGRGRLAGKRDEMPQGLAGSLPRFRARGGVVLEPFFHRVADYSMSYHLDGPTSWRRLATMEVLGSRSGSYLGHGGVIDREGNLTLPAVEEKWRATTESIVATMAREGYVGPLGLDFFSYRAGNQIRHRLSEINARFTMGVVAFGIFERIRRSPLFDARWLQFSFHVQGQPDTNLAPGDVVVPLTFDEMNITSWFHFRQ